MFSAKDIPKTPGERFLKNIEKDVVDEINKRRNVCCKRTILRGTILGIILSQIFFGCVLMIWIILNVVFLPDFWFLSIIFSGCYFYIMFLNGCYLCHLVYKKFLVCDYCCGSEYRSRLAFQDINLDTFSISNFSNLEIDVTEITPTFKEEEEFEDEFGGYDDSVILELPKHIADSMREEQEQEQDPFSTPVARKRSNTYCISSSSTKKRGDEKREEVIEIKDERNINSIRNQLKIIVELEKNKLESNPEEETDIDLLEKSPTPISPIQEIFRCDKNIAKLSNLENII